MKTERIKVVTEEEIMDELLDRLHEIIRDDAAEGAEKLPEYQGRDPIHHPDHYTWKGVECIKVIEIMTRGLSGIEAYYMGNIIKYLFRYPKKGSLEMDLMKTEEYTGLLRKYLLKKRTGGK